MLAALSLSRQSWSQQPRLFQSQGCQRCFSCFRSNPQPPISARLCSLPRAHSSTIDSSVSFPDVLPAKLLHMSDMRGPKTAPQRPKARKGLPGPKVDDKSAKHLRESEEGGATRAAMVSKAAARTTATATARATSMTMASGRKNGDPPQGQFFIPDPFLRARGPESGPWGPTAAKSPRRTTCGNSTKTNPSKNRRRRRERQRRR